jgi:threonine-phosphate decarboxylase
MKSHYSNLIIPSNKTEHVTFFNRIRKTASELTPCIHGARIKESEEKSGKNLNELIDYSVNLNPLGQPDLTRILADSYRTINNYPDNRYITFREVAAEALEVQPENIIPGNGSSELIRLFAEVVIQPGDSVTIPFPTFGEYEFQCRLFGAVIKHIDYGNILELEPEDCKAVFLCNPNNPTGRLLNSKEVLKLARRCIESEVFFFVDEAFIELSDPEESIAGFAASNDFVIVLRSLTKTYAVPGLRIGFAVASQKFANVMDNIRIPWNLNSVAQAVGERLLNKKGRYFERSLELIRKEREWLTFMLNSIRGFRPYPSDANYILVDVNEFALNSAELARRMLDHGIIIRECASFGLVNHIRVAVRKRNENRKLIRAFSSVISEWGSQLAEREIDKALKQGITSRSRLNCEYYPCHFEGQDCTFCFCPFYPCKNERTGGEIIQKSTGGTVWSCAGCDLIHKREIADKVLKTLMEGKKIRNVWKLVMEPAIN